MAEQTRAGIPVDIVDRQPRHALHGASWTTQADSMLDEIARLQKRLATARAELLMLGATHPNIETDAHYVLAVLATA